MEYLFDTRPLQHLLPLHNGISKLNQEHSATGPELRRLVMSGDLGLKATSVTDPFDNTSDERSTVEHAHFPRHTDICVDQWVVVCDHVLVRGIWGDGVFEGICGAAEYEPPEGSVDEVQQGYDAERAVRG